MTISMQWANAEDILSEPYKELLKRLWYLEEFVPTYRHDSAHPTRRFEYPWAIFNSGLVKGDRMLNAGSGTDVFGFYLSLWGPTVNLDINPAVIEQGIEQADGSFSNLEFQVGDIMKLPFQDNYFDRVYAISSIEHAGKNKILDCCKELLRVTRLGGVLIITLDIERNGLSVKDVEQVFGPVPPPPESMIEVFEPKDPTHKILTLGVKVVK